MTGTMAASSDNGVVRYRILGTTQALRSDGTPVPVGGARLRALLTVLALRPGRPVPASVLVDEVWPAEPPADAAGALQALVGRLRRAIGAQALRSVDGGYQLCASADDVDAYRFERLAAEGARALADGDAQKAAVVLDDALTLWQGPALADLPDRISAAARWETRRHDVRRARLEAALALGHAEQVLPELTALCDAHPLEEPLQVLRLRALRDAGRPAEALAAYEDVRRDLSTRLGTDPGPELRTLHAQLLRPQDAPASRAHPGRVPTARTAPGHPDATAPNSPAVTDPAPATPAAPAASESRPSVAPAPASPRTARPQEPPPHPVAPPPPGNLRARLTSFVGRETDIEAIRGRLGGARLITLLGPGGAGKTRLSQEAAEGAADTMPDGVWLAELAPVDRTADPAAVPEAVVTALGARETVLRGAGAEELRHAAERHADDPLVRLTEYCARRRLLLVLDNCEHVVEAAARLVAQLLERCPGLTVLATSREPLGVPGEVLYPVEPLPEPVAARLLAERGAAARPEFRVEDDPEAVAEICRRLDGLPLAIELAAARLRLLTPRQIADRLDDRFRLLTGGARTVLPRQQTLRAVVDWSWELLAAPERAVLRRLSVFAGGCDLAAAEAVCGPDALDALGSLVDKSLVAAAPDGRGGMRYRLLETVAEYAAERLAEAGDEAAAESAHLVHFRELARITDPQLRGPGQAAAIAVFAVDYENLRTALRCAVARRDEQEALCLALSLCWYWQMHDLRHEARTWSRAVAELGPDPFAEPVIPAVALHERCTDAPPPMRADVLAEARRGVHLVHIASMDMDRDMETWQAPAGQARLRAITQAYRPGLPQTCRVPGSLWFYAVILTGNLETLHGTLDENVRTCRALDYRWELAMTLQMRANLLANRSDLEGDAFRDADESLTIFTSLGDAWGEAEALSARAEARERKGDFAGAEDDYRAAMAHTERLGARSQVAVLTARLASVLIELGDDERGETMLREVIAQKWHGSNEAMPAGRLFLAMLLSRTGRVAEAREQLRLLRVDYGAGFVVFDGFVASIDAWLCMVEGRYEDGLALARQSLHKALDPLAHMIAPQLSSVQLALGAVGYVHLDGGARAADAARLMGAALGLLPAGHIQNVLERQITAEVEATARAVLGDAGYAAAYAEGGDLSLEEATALL